jgi:hypothetical protein
VKVSELESQNAVLLQSVKKLQLQLNSVHASDGMNENPDAGISFLSQNEITASLRQDLDATRSRIKKLVSC